jgi:hypothetical protein
MKQLKESTCDDFIVCLAYIAAECPELGREDLGNKMPMVKPLLVALMARSEPAMAVSSGGTTRSQVKNDKAVAGRKEEELMLKSL